MSAQEESVVGLILGAGKSDRFGSPKQLLPYRDTTLLGQVVRNARASKLDRVIVVLGRAAEQIRQSLEPGRHVIVDNTSYGTGCASSLLAGLDMAGDCAALLLLLGDQPGVRPDFIDQAIAAWKRTRPWAAVTSYQDGLGHPFLFAREAFDALRKLHGDKAVWKLIEAHPERVLRIEMDASLPLDVDTPEDYAQVLAIDLAGPA